MGQRGLCILDVLPEIGFGSFNSRLSSCGSLLSLSNESLSFPLPKARQYFVT